nr:hypothetical protein [Tanacetum cinerariifolium]
MMDEFDDGSGVLKLRLDMANPQLKQRCFGLLQA